jgi:hypothetical protein
MDILNSGGMKFFDEVIVVLPIPTCFPKESPQHGNIARDMFLIL